MPKKNKKDTYDDLRTLLGGCENLPKIFFDASPDTILVLDKNYDIIHANVNTAVLFHQTPDDLIGKNYANLLTPQSKYEFLRYHDNKDHDIFVGERQVFKFGGRVISVMAKETPLVDTENHLKGIILHLEDISEIIKSEELLHLRSSALEATAIGIAITNNRGDIVWVNSAFTELTGYNENELLYKNMRILKSGKQEDAFYSELWETILAGKIWHGELYNKRKDGQFYTEEQSITPALDKNGYISHFIVTKVNISRRKKMEEELRQMNEELEQLVRKRTDQLAESEKMAALGQLVAGVAHEINNPVGIGYTAATYLKDQTEMLNSLYTKNELKKSDLEKYLNNLTQLSVSLESNLTRAADLIRNFKQLAVDQSTEEKRAFFIKKYFEETVSSLNPQFAGTNHRVNVTGPDTLQVVSYPGVYSQIITNLILNSLIHGFENRDDGMISIDVSALDESLYISYFDNGCGIPKKHIKKIFDPFFSTKFGRGGSGLGLNIVYNLVKSKLKGTINCKSEPDKGVNFNIIVPLEKDE